MVKLVERIGIGGQYTLAVFIMQIYAT